MDAAIAATARASNNHTLNGQDLNNFAPRIGFAYSPLDSNRMVIRGGFGFFYDRPSASFINTVFSNYPFLREIEITVPSGNVPFENAFSAQPTNLSLASWLPFRVTRASGVGGSYVIRDNTGVTRDPRGTTTSPAGNIAETFEFRAVDRDLKTPYVQQWNLGVQYELTKNLLFEARYVARAARTCCRQSPSPRASILRPEPRITFTNVLIKLTSRGAPNGPLNAGATARQRGTGRLSVLQILSRGSLGHVCGRRVGRSSRRSDDLNLANPITCSGSTIVAVKSLLRSARAGAGLQRARALLLRSNGDSRYHGAQFSVTQRRPEVCTSTLLTHYRNQSTPARLIQAAPPAPASPTFRNRIRGQGRPAQSRGESCSLRLRSNASL